MEFTKEEVDLALDILVSEQVRLEAYLGRPWCRARAQGRLYRVDTLVNKFQSIRDAKVEVPA